MKNTLLKTFSDALIQKLHSLSLRHGRLKGDEIRSLETSFSLLLFLYIYMHLKCLLSFSIDLKDDIKTLEQCSTTVTSTQCFEDDVGVTMDSLVAGTSQASWTRDAQEILTLVSHLRLPQPQNQATEIEHDMFLWLAMRQERNKKSLKFHIKCISIT